LANSLHKGVRGNRQSGAAMVEMAIVISLFLVLVFGIIEFALVIFHWSKLNEATRAGARYAIVNDPACSIYTDTNDPDYKKCDGGPLDCSDPSNNQKVVVESGACTVGDPYKPRDAGCRIVERMRAIQPLIGLSDPVPDVVITYTCTDAGFAGLTQKVPSVSVGICSAEDVSAGLCSQPLEYNLIVPGLLGLDASVNMPGFDTTRTGEDLDTVN
jgi:hypothetical protein